MLNYIKGKIVSLAPYQFVIESNQIGYDIKVSKTAFVELSMRTDTVKILVHQEIREDKHNLFGFFDQQEKDIFKRLITVSGIGCNTALRIISGLTVTEITEAIQNKKAKVFEAISGIGLKTAVNIIETLGSKKRNISSKRKQPALPF